MSTIVIRGQFTGGGGDFTPAAVNWGNITVTQTDGAQEVNSDQTFTAINEVITIKATWTHTESDSAKQAKLQFYKNGVAVGALGTSPQSCSFSVNDTCHFGMLAYQNLTTGVSDSGTVTVTNESDASTVLDTFTYAVQYIYDGGGGTGLCVWEDAWIDEARQAKDLAIGQTVDVLGPDFNSVTTATIDALDFSDQVCVRLKSRETGIRLTMSISTPVTQPDGSVIMAPDALGARVAVDDGAGGVFWDYVDEVQLIGALRVAHVRVGQKTYAAADGSGRRRMFAHNPKP